jgi:molecular chaperone DnaJ
MADKNYYLVLGVPRTETTAGIRARFRDLARALHPDVAGEQSTGAFQELTEAYEALVDPVARRRHNIELAASDRRPPVQPVATPGGPGWRHSVSPPVALDGEPDAVRPSLDALLERLFRNFTGVRVPKAERPEGLTLEVILTPEEAVRGVELPVAVPAVARCPGCGGEGRVWLYTCAACGGRGMVETPRTLRIAIPPMVRPRSLVEVPLDGLGIRNLYLRLLVRIE